MSETEEKTLLPEGDYIAQITDLTDYDALATGNPYIKIHLKVEGFHLVVYQTCGSILRGMIMRNKELYIGQKTIAKVKHNVVGGDMVYQEIRAMTFA